MADTVIYCPTCSWSSSDRLSHSMHCKGKLVDVDLFDGSTAPVNDAQVEVRSVSSTGAMKGVKLERFDLIPIGPLTDLARHYGRGAQKYEVHNWRKGYEWSKSYSAIQRHLTAFWGGEEYDTCPSDRQGCADNSNGTPLPIDSDIPSFDGTCYNHTGNHHMVAVAWHAFTLLEFIKTHPDFDDRYKRVTND